MSKIFARPRVAFPEDVRLETKDGTVRLFESQRPGGLELTRLLESPAGVAHLRYRVVR